jgi:hypothetical protein
LGTAKEKETMTDDEVLARLDQLAEQQAIQTNALIAALEARWAGGANTVDGYVKALNPEITTEPKIPLYEQ